MPTWAWILLIVAVVASAAWMAYEMKIAPTYNDDEDH